MSRKDDVDNFITSVCNEILRVYDLVESNNYARFIGNIYFTKLPKKEYYEQRYLMTLKVSTDLKDFIISDKIDLHNKNELTSLLNKCFRSTGKYFEYSETIETSLGVYNDKHISIVFDKGKES